MKSLLAILFAVALLQGCTLPLKPGRSSIKPGEVLVVQSENPKTSTKQDYSSVTDTNGVTVVTVRTEIGAAQKDVAREIGAKLGALRPVMWAGIFVFLFGAASLVYPPLKLAIGSVTTSAVIALAGLVMIILPTLVVGNEILILSVTGGIAAVWFFAHRHGGVRGQLNALKDTLK